MYIKPSLFAKTHSYDNMINMQNHLFIPTVSENTLGFNKVQQ